MKALLPLLPEDPATSRTSRVAKTQQLLLGGAQSTGTESLCLVEKEMGKEREQQT